MAVNLIYDWDYFHYPSVIPNLECAKYAAYQKKKRNIAVLNDVLLPERYTHTFLRKDYDDGVYYDQITTDSSIEYGGRAYSQVYQPFDMEMEMIEPDFSIYEKYKDYFGTRRVDKNAIRTILNATHVRLSIDSKNLIEFPYERLRPAHPSIIIHDYDISSIPGSFELLEDASKNHTHGRAYRIGNKFPIITYTFDELWKWLQLTPMSSCFYLQYNGFFTDEQLIELLENPTLGLQSLVYNFTYNFQDDQDFLINGLSQFYKQALFLRSNNKRILLNIDTSFFQTPELFNLMKLINCFYGKGVQPNVVPSRQTLYGFCAWKKRAELEVLPWVRFSVTKEEMRQSFQYVRKHNYEVFDMFYSMPSVIAKGGKLVNEWKRDKS